jgi:outer membrane protein TolC
MKKRNKYARISVMKTMTAAVLSLSLLLCSGCGGIDLWGVGGKAPPSPSSYHRPDDDLSIGPHQKPDAGEVEGKNLGLEECIRIALRRNPRARTSWHASRAAAARAGAARSGFFPDVTAAGNLGRSDLLTVSGTSASPRTQFSGSLNVEFTVFDGLGRWAKAAGANAELDEFNARHNATLDDIVLGVKEGFHSLVAAEELLTAMQEGRRQSMILLNMARARHENGLVPKADVLRAGTNLAEADLHLTRAASAVRTAQGRLAVAMGLPATTRLRLKAPAGHPKPDRARREVNELLQVAARRRPELLAALASVSKQEAAVRKARAAWWPTVSFQGSYGFRDEVFLPEQDEWSLGLGVRLPLFSGFRTGYGVREAEEKLAEAEGRLEELLREVEFGVWTEVLRLENALSAIQASKALLASAGESVRAAEGEYKNGTGSMPDLTTARAANTSAEVALIRATLDWRVSLARLEKTVGGASAMKGTPGTPSVRKVR